jgi:Tol biopolymer transport system component
MALKHEVLAAAAIALVLSCSSSTSPHGANPYIGFVAGNKQTDTVQSTLTQALEVHVTAIGSNSAAGQVVQFLAVQNSSGNYEALMSPLTALQPTSVLVDTTDGFGNASVNVTLGTTAGTASIVVKVPQSGFVDTARFTITPGALAGLRSTPGDTAIAVGASYTLKTTTLDRFGNARSDPVTLSVLLGPASISGETVTGTASGGAVIVGTAGTFTDTALVAVVPAATIAASNHQGIVVFNLDGTGMHTISPSTPTGNIKWNPTGDHLVFDTSNGCEAGTGNLYTTDTLGNTTQVDASTAYDQYPSYSHDGTWIYYTRNGIPSGESSNWRVHPDGTANDSLTTTTPDFDIYPSPSPDGTRVAYVADRSYSSDLRIITLSSGAVQSLGVNAWSPEWSPAGSQIAYITGRTCTAPIALINPDGTGIRTLTTDTYLASFDWSPDGQWIVATNAENSFIDLISVTTGQAVLLPFTSGLYSPTWRPGHTPSMSRLRHAIASSRTTRGHK